MEMDTLGLSLTEPFKQTKRQKPKGLSANVKPDGGRAGSMRDLRRDPRDSLGDVLAGSPDDRLPEASLIPVKNGEGHHSDQKPHISLFQAVRYGDLGTVKEWIEYNSRKQQQNRNHGYDKYGFTPIHYAAKFNQLEIMKLLCKKGNADISAETVLEQYTPLHLASRYNAYNVYEATNQAARLSHHYDEEDGLDTTSTVQSDGEFASNTLTRQFSSQKVINFILQQGKIDVNAKDKYGVTPLHFACQVGNIDGVEELLRQEKIILDATDGNGDTPLHEACFHGNVTVTKMLLTKMKEGNLEPALKNDLGLSPLHLACREGHTEIVSLLLDEEYSTTDGESQVLATDNEGANALHFACQRDNDDIMKMLLKTLSKENVGEALVTRKHDGITPVHIAAQHGCRRLMEVILEDTDKIISPSVDVNIADNYCQTPLHFAAENGKHEIVELLLLKGADVEARDVDDYTPLLTAAQFGCKESFSLLQRHGACVDVQNKDRKNVVFLAAESNHADIVEEILKSTSGRRLCLIPNSLIDTPLHAAAKKGNLAALQRLLECGQVKVEAKNIVGKTAMHLAAEKDHVHIIMALECHPELAKSTDENGDTPLHLACKCGHMEVAKRLVKVGADVEARNVVRWTPMDCAAFYGHATVIELLVLLKAEVDPKDKLKATPLQLAAKEGHVTAVKTLLKHNASMSSVDNCHFNALDLAIANGHSDVAEAIIRSPKWKTALDNYTTTRDGEITSPFRKLIKRMPEVAELVLNRCTSTNAKEKNIKPDSEAYCVTFDYHFLEDRQSAIEWKEDTDSPAVEDSGRMRKKIWQYLKPLNIKHPMKIMVESRRPDLLKHPLVYSLIELKWDRYGRGLFYSMLLLHVLFVILLMTFALVLLNPFSLTCVAVSSGRFNLTQPSDLVAIDTILLQPPHDAVLKDYLVDANITVAMAAGIVRLDGHTLCFNATPSVRDAVASVVPIQPICGECGLSTAELMFVETAAVIIILYSLLRLVLEVGYFLQQLHQYFLDMSTWVDVPLFICAILFVSVFQRDCLCPREWQWEVGIIAVFLVWAHLILYMRRMRVLDTGIYVLMFKNIFLRFLKLTILTILLLLMFALTFYMTFKQFHRLFAHSPFASPLHSILKTISMCIGELGYDELFRQPTGGSTAVILDIPFPEISYILWVIFVILMPILFGNLLVGLAVDDIKGILETAVLTRLALRVELVLSLEDRFWFLPWVKKLQQERSSRTIHPHRNHVKRLFSPLLRLLRGENYGSAEHISHVLNPTKTPVEQQTQTLMREMSKIQETLKELPKLQEALCKLLEQSKNSPSPRPRIDTS